MLTDTITASSFAVIGAGNGGQAMAGFLALRNFGVNLWNRSEDKIAAVSYTHLDVYKRQGKLCMISLKNASQCWMKKCLRTATILALTAANQQVKLFSMCTFTSYPGTKETQTTLEAGSEESFHIQE